MQHRAAIAIRIAKSLIEFPPGAVFLRAGAYATLGRE